MKSLILIRHAKSSWDNNLSDKLRPIIKKGVKSSEKIALASSHLFQKETSIFSSDAVRTRETARIFCDVLNLNFFKIQFNDLLYTFDYRPFSQFIKNIDDTHNKIVVFGHNFALTDFINQHTDIEIDNLPTSGLVEIIFDCKNWKNIEKGRLAHRFFPKEL
jgi:phosphohistidine phosphatase